LRDLIGGHLSSHSLLGMLQPTPESQDTSPCERSLAEHRRRRPVVEFRPPAGLKEPEQSNRTAS
jgi:hypothetical protein